MQIVKAYKFYAAHRNQDLCDKCWNLHGHRYGVEVTFNVVRKDPDQDAVTTLFGDFDAKIEPFLKNHYDHSLLLDRNDPLVKYLEAFQDEVDQSFKIKWFDRPTSVENLCLMLFGEFQDLGFDVEKIEVKETDSSTVAYTKDDYREESGVLNIDREDA